jgi:hypothetical protein
MMKHCCFVAVAFEGFEALLQTLGEFAEAKYPAGQHAVIRAGAIGLYDGKLLPLCEGREFRACPSFLDSS